MVIRLKAEDNFFTFYVGNTTEQRKDLSDPFNREGIGLVNLKRRLELLYPNRYSINFEQEADYYQATLKLEFG